VEKMTLTLGDAFARRKQINSKLDDWFNRLSLAGRNIIKYETKEIEGEDSFKPVPGTRTEYKRNYTIEECQRKIQALIEEDKILAKQISLTNQRAKANLTDLDENEISLTIPELLVLKNDIAPKLERAAASIPKLAKGVEVIQKTDTYTKWRKTTPYYKTKQSLSDKGHKIEEEVIDYYDVEEVTDFGVTERNVYDEIDKIHAWQHRIKEAINQANKTELIEIE
jgi:hypothetical protein